MIPEIKKIAVTPSINLSLNITESGKKRWLIMTHGIGEHSGRHKHLYDLFSEHYNLCLYDLRGHGVSGGKRAYIEDFSHFSSDLLKVIEYLQEEFSMEDYTLIGHSMGGLIVSDFMQNHIDGLKILPTKVFLSSPAVSPAGILGNLCGLAPVNLFDKLSQLPSFKVGGVLDLSKLSHDPRVYEAYITDELNILKAHTKLMIEIIKKSKEVFSRPLNIPCELYCGFGSLDGLVDATKVKNYFETFEKKAVMCEVQGGYHELHNEIEKYKKPYFDFLKNSLI